MDCPKCKIPLIVRTSRPSSKEREREKYVRCEKCGHAETVRTSR